MPSASRRHDRDHTAMAVALGPHEVVLDCSGALYWPAESMLVVADLHFEKGSAAAIRGRMLPPYDTRETIDRLARVMDRYDPARVVALGDSLHDGRALERMDAADLEALSILQEGREWIWIAGNHDPEGAAGIGGVFSTGMVVNGTMLRHEPHPGPAVHEIAGHLHPAARVSIDGHVFRRPCFAGNRQRLILPAFGAFTGDLNVLDPAFEPLFGEGGVQVWLLGQDALYPMAPRVLRPDRA
jgi:DNA ligase-associated metallophosphoesterase